ncbi:MAG: zeta toxin family protein [Chitinophagales bacterium]|nr:zeta toxin family protein [Chitinophagales bacterium]
MNEKNLYIIAGCNGAGKTTASFTVLPEYINCKEFVNADEIARGLSPFQPEKVAFEAGRIMLQRIHELIDRGDSFAFETTLASKTYKNYIQFAMQNGYSITLFFFWLQTVELAIERVKTRVSEGGHDIPHETIERRYYRGIKNLFEIYLPIADSAFLFDNSDGKFCLFAEKADKQTLSISNIGTFGSLKSIYDKT